MNVSRILLAVSLVLAATHANAGELLAPVSGFVLDPKLGAIRPINGFPGGASLGGPLDLGQAVVAFAYSPLADTAVAANSEGSALLITSLSTTPAVTAIPASIDRVDRVAVDTLGKFVALYSSGTAQIQVRELSKSDSQAEIDVRALGELTGLTVERGSILITTATGAYYWNWEIRKLEALVDAAEGVSGTFGNGGNDVILADRSRSEVFLITNVNGDRKGRTLGGAEQGVRDPIGVMALEDGTVIAISGSRSELLLLRPNGSAEALSIAPRVKSQPAVLGLNLVGLTSPGDGTLFVLEANASPSVWFVPQAEQQVSQ